MPVSNYDTGFPQGVTIRNVPILDLQNGDGYVWWVDSNRGSNDNKGTFKYPFATLDYAISRCVANRGDKILVAAGHAETIEDATSLIADIAGIQIYGMGSSDNRPTISFATSTAASMVISAANVYIGNMIFVCNIDNQVTMLDCNSTSTIIENCLFKEGTGSGLTFVDINGGASNACDGVQLINCILWNDNASSNATAGIELGEVAANVQIVGCQAFGYYSSAAIHNPTGKVLTNLRIIRGSYSNYSAGQHAIELVAACTGVLNDTRLYSDNLATVLDPGALMCNGNYAVAAVDTAGTPIP